MRANSIKNKRSQSLPAQAMRTSRTEKSAGDIYNDMRQLDQRLAALQEAAGSYTQIA